VSESSGAHALSVRNIALRFGGITAIEDVSFDVHASETVGVIGPNGAGKTALLNCISGVYTPASGTVLFESRRITGLLPNRVAALGIARTFQNTDQFHLFTVADYVLLGRLHHLRSSVLLSLFAWPWAERAERAERMVVTTLLERLGLQEFAHARLGELPFGVQKRIDIARALAAEPRLLLLDEPTSGIVTSERAEISAAIGHVDEIGVTTVLVDHDIDFVVRHCGNVVVLNHGKQIAIGDPVEVLRRPEVVTAFVGTRHARSRSVQAVEAEGDRDTA
jgi:branched-chain amino acid transport system ATP-binding protein